MPTEHTLLLALFGLLALTVGLLALLIYLVLSDRHRRGAEGDDLCDAHLTQIYKKLGVENRTSVAIKAKDNGIIPRQDSKQP